MPAGGQPSIADDVVRHAAGVVAGVLVVTGKPAPDNTIRIVACWTGAAGSPRPDPPPTPFRYVTFDAP